MSCIRSGQERKRPQKKRLTALLHLWFVIMLCKSEHDTCSSYRDKKEAHHAWWALFFKQLSIMPHHLRKMYINWSTRPGLTKRVKQRLTFFRHACNEILCCDAEQKTCMHRGKIRSYSLIPPTKIYYNEKDILPHIYRLFLMDCQKEMRPIDEGYQQIHRH